MACVSKIGSLYEMVTKNVIVSTTNTVFGINPRAWIALPCEGLILLKIRQVVPTAHQHTIRHRVLWIETLFYHFSVCSLWYCS